MTNAHASDHITETVFVVWYQYESGPRNWYKRCFKDRDLAFQFINGIGHSYINKTLVQYGSLTTEELS